MMMTMTAWRVGDVLLATALLFLKTSHAVLVTEEEMNEARFGAKHRSLTGNGNGGGTAIVTTTACNIIRSQNDYQARLDLFYFYLVEYPAGSVPDLVGIERAIATSIASKLNDCDDDDGGGDNGGGPLYAVQVTGTGHRLSTGGICDASKEGDRCRVIRGLTSIFLDQDPSVVEFAAYEEIEATLADSDLLNQFTNSSLVQAELIRRIGQNLVILDIPSSSQSGSNSQSGSSAGNGSTGGGSLGNVTTKIAVAAACIAFVLTAFFIYGVLRNQAAAVQAGNPNTKTRLAHMQAKRRKFWSSLEEGNQSPGCMVTDQPIASITWSVSDLTSDSASIRSALRMDRIEEDSREGDTSEDRGGGDDDDEEEVATSSDEESGSENPSPVAIAKKKKTKKMTLSPNVPDPSIEENYINHWKDKAETESSNQSESQQPKKNVRSDMKLGSVWDVAGMPESYFDDSDPEAETPVRSNSVKDFDVTTTGPNGGCAFMHDSLEDESAADLELQFDLDNHNITDPTEDSEHLRKIMAVAISPNHDFNKSGDEIRHSLALSITDEEAEDEEEEDDSCSRSDCTKSTNGEDETRLSLSVTDDEEEEEQEQGDTSLSFKDAKQTLTESMDDTTNNNMTQQSSQDGSFVDNSQLLEHSFTKTEFLPPFTPAISWPNAHAKGEWAQTTKDGSSTVKVEYLQFFTPELGKASTDHDQDEDIVVQKKQEQAPKSAPPKVAVVGFQSPPPPTKAASFTRLEAPPLPTHDESGVSAENDDDGSNNSSSDEGSTKSSTVGEAAGDSSNRPPDDDAAAKSWAQRVMTKLEKTKDQKLISM